MRLAPKSLRFGRELCKRVKGLRAEFGLASLVALDFAELNQHSEIIEIDNDNMAEERLLSARRGMMGSDRSFEICKLLNSIQLN